MNLEIALQTIEEMAQGQRPIHVDDRQRALRYLEGWYVMAEAHAPHRDRVHRALAWGVLNRPNRATGPGFFALFRFLFRDFPRAVRRYFGWIALSACLFTGSLAASATYLHQHPGMAWSIASPEMREHIIGHERAQHLQNPEVDPTQGQSAFYATNNARVALYLFAGGISAGLITLYGLIHNGLIVGTSLVLMDNIDGYQTLLNFMVAHAFTELLALFIAAGGGFVIAHAILRPGPKSRRHALAAAAKSAIQLALGAAGMMVIAAVIEAWVSPATSPFSVDFKMQLGLASAAFWLVYFSLAGRWQH